MCTTNNIPFEFKIWLRKKEKTEKREDRDEMYYCIIGNKD
jgi:hypothetical protein